MKFNTRHLLAATMITAILLAVLRHPFKLMLEHMDWTAFWGTTSLPLRHFLLVAGVIPTYENYGFGWSALAGMLTGSIVATFVHVALLYWFCDMCIRLWGWANE